MLPMERMGKHAKDYVRFFYPGLIFCEQSVKPISGPDTRVKFPKGSIGYQRLWREEKTVKGETLTCSFHAVGGAVYKGKVLKLDQVIAKYGATSIAADNMRINNFERIVDTGRGIFPLEKDDEVIED